MSLGLSIALRDASAGNVCGTLKTNESAGVCTAEHGAERTLTEPLLSWPAMARERFFLIFFKEVAGL